jgi:hypothetical protein
VEVREDEEGSVSPKVAVVKLVGTSRDRQAEVWVTRVNSTNVLNEGLRIGEIGRRMNSKVKLVEIGVCRK